MESQIKPRKSFIDRRRKSLTLTNIFSEDNEDPDLKKPKLSMKEYRESLLVEKEEWKEIFKLTKKKCEESERKLKFEPYEIEKKMIEDKITPEYKSFLKDRPNYIEMVNTVQRYVDCIQLANIYKSDIIDYYDKACKEIEINNKCLIEEMSSDDLCDVCNTKNCTLPHHKFNIM